MSRTFTIYTRTKRPELKPVKWQKEWFEFTYKDVKKSTGKNEDDFEITMKEEIVLTNIDEHIKSFQDECGIRAMMKRIAMSGDLSLLDQIPENHADLSIIPDLPQDKLAAFKKAQDAFEAIDPELRGSMKMEDFIKSIDGKKIQAYIDAKIEAATKPIKEEKPKERTNE